MGESVEAQRDKGSYLRSWTQEGEELNLGPRSSVFEALSPYSSCHVLLDGPQWSSINGELVIIPFHMVLTLMRLSA